MSARKPTNCSTPSIQAKTNTPSRLSASTGAQITAERRCDCESVTCHPQADCTHAGTVSTIYSTVCAECAAKLPPKYLAENERKRSLSADVDGTPDEINATIDRMNRADAAPAQESKTWTPDSNPRRRKEDQPGSARTYFIKADECVRLCEARAAVGLNPLGWKAGAGDPLTAADARLAAEDDRKTPPPMGEDDMERDRR